MKRYYTFQTPPDPTKFNPHGQYHYQSLEGGGYICVAMEESMDPPADWVEIGHLLDPSPVNFNGVNTTPGPYVHSATAVTPAPTPLEGITVADNMFQIARKIAGKNPRSPFHP